MKVIKCNSEVAVETIGEARNSKTKSKMAESQFALSDEMVVSQLKLNAKNQNTTKSTQTWLNVWESISIIIHCSHHLSSRWLKAYS